MKKREFMLSAVLCGILISCMLGSARADWTPASDEIAPSKDAYVSITGSLAEPAINFGGAETLSVGKGLDGHCVGAIQFDLSSVPSDAISLVFKSDVVVYGEQTRTLRVFIIVDKDWDELAVMGVEEPFNASEVLIADDTEYNCTVMTIVGSTTEISVNVTDWMGSSKITLVFTTGILSESWLTMQSSENTYLTSLSDPPRLVFTQPSASQSPGDALFGIVGFVIVISIIAFIVIKKRKTSKI